MSSKQVDQGNMRKATNHTSQSQERKLLCVARRRDLATMRNAMERPFLLCSSTQATPARMEQPHIPVSACELKRWYNLRENGFVTFRLFQYAVASPTVMVFFSTSTSPWDAKHSHDRTKLCHLKSFAKNPSGTKLSGPSNMWLLNDVLLLSCDGLQKA